MATLFGFVFLSHQPGSFIGVWLADTWFDLYANYDFIRHASIVPGVLSADFTSARERTGCNGGLFGAVGW